MIHGPASLAFISFFRFPHRTEVTHISLFVHRCFLVDLLLLLVHFRISYTLLDMLPTGFWVFGCFRGERLALLGNILVLMILLPGNDHVLAQNGVVPQCYFPNQEIAIDNYACVLSSSNSACCGIGNVCLDNGLCAPGNGEIIRGACTDQTWRSAACPQYCLRT